MSLEEELQEIRGIGEAKASEIVDIVEDHEDDSEAQELVQEAIGYLDAGHPGYAKKYLRRVLE